MAISLDGAFLRTLVVKSRVVGPPGGRRPHGSATRSPGRPGPRSGAPCPRPAALTPPARPEQRRGPEAGRPCAGPAVGGVGFLVDRPPTARANSTGPRSRSGGGRPARGWAVVHPAARVARRCRRAGARAGVGGPLPDLWG